MKYAEQLDQHFETTVGQPIHCNVWFRFYVFDVIGDLALGKSFNMLTEKNWHHSIAMMTRFMELVGRSSPVPWATRLGNAIPGISQGWNDWLAYCKRRMQERILVS